MNMRKDMSTAQRRSVTLHGREVAYTDYPGKGPAMVLLHGVGSSSEGWDESAELLAASGARVISVDLPGHGDSSRDRGDYSLGSLASTVRDLIDHLNLGPVILVGHSLGGGISLQFLYQYPAHVRGLVLVSSGGLGREANWALRLASLPGSGVVIGAALNKRTLAAYNSAHRTVRKALRRGEEAREHALERFGWLAESDRRHTFLSTLRSVVDVSGQRVSALEKLHLSRSLPVLIIWGRKDAIIPVSHGEMAHSMLDHSEFVVFDDAAHEPHRTDPERFATTVSGWRTRHFLTRTQANEARSAGQGAFSAGAFGTGAFAAGATAMTSALPGSGGTNAAGPAGFPWTSAGMV